MKKLFFVLIMSMTFQIHAQEIHPEVAFTRCMQLKIEEYTGYFVRQGTPVQPYEVAIFRRPNQCGWAVGKLCPPGSSCATELNNGGITTPCFIDTTCPTPPAGPVVGFKSNHLSGPIIVQPLVCGSVINPVKQTVSEQIVLNNNDFYLNNSSEFNPYIKKNRSVYQELKNIGENRGRLALSIYGNNYQSPVLNKSIVFSPITVNWQWDGLTGNISTNPIVDKARFIMELADLPLAQVPSPTIGEPYVDYYVNYIDENSRTIRQIKTYAGSDDMSAYPIYFEGQDLVIYKPEMWGLSGWTMSHHHYFERGTKMLYIGAGEKVKVEAFKTITLPEYGQVDLVSTHFSDEIYIFSREGVHLETKTKLLGKTKYKFSYKTGSHKILSFSDINGKLTEFVYGTDGWISRIKYGSGFETDFQTESGLITKVSEFGRDRYQVTYDPTSLINTFLKPNGELTTFTYDPEGKFVSEVKNTNKNQFFMNSLIGDLREFINSNNQGAFSKTEFEELASNNWVRQKNGDGSLISSTLVNSDSKTVYAGTNTFSFSKFYDEMWGKYYNESNPGVAYYRESGQSINVSRYDQLFHQYGDATNPLSITSIMHKSAPSGSSSFNLTTYDVATKVVTNKSINNKITLIQLDDAERVTRISPSNKFATDFTYNSDGKLTRVQKGSQFTNYTYTASGLLKSETNSKNQTISYSYNQFGNVAQKTLPNLDTIKFEYSDGNEIKKIIAPNNQVHNFSLGIGDYLTQLITPLNKQTTYTYDDDKRLKKVVKASQKKIVYSYYPNSSMVSTIVTPEGTVSLNTYDVQSRVRSITSADGIMTNLDWVGPALQQQVWYDTDGSVIGKLSNSFTSDQIRIADIKLNDQFISYYGYGYDGKVYSVNNATYSYETVGYAETTRINFNGLITAYTTEETASGDKPIQYVSSQVADSPNMQIFVSMKRSFDAFGQASDYTQTTLNTNTGVYNQYFSLVPTYDANNRLVEVAKNRKSFLNSQEINSTDFFNQYNYPQGSNNNVKEYSQTLTPSAKPIKRTVASHSNDDQLLSLKGSINRDYQYTDDGDLKSMTNCFGTINYEYDVFGNLKKVTLVDGKVIEYKVDAYNRRIKKLVNGVTKEYYLWYDQTRLAAILNSSKIPVLTYIYGPESFTPSYVKKNNSTYKILHDPGMGSVRYVINPLSLQIVQEIDYDEFGNVMKNTNPDFQPLQYAGGLYDADTKLLKFGARDYDPTVGRWTTKDPIGFAGGDTNLYAYVGGNPMSFVDPDGRIPVPVIALGFGFGVGFASGYATQRQLTPNAKINELLKAGFKGGLITLGGVGIAISGAGAVAGGAATASGLMYNFLNAPGDADVNLGDLSNGLDYLRTKNQTNKCLSVGK